MSDSNVPLDAGSQPLQFDEAQFGSAESLVRELSCAACKRPVLEGYFEVGGQKMCPTCKDAVIMSFRGSGVAAFFRAWLFGAGAGIAGCGLYYAVLALTGYQVGLIAIVVGLMVGIAVRKGSRFRGGWLYQAMAMVITYGSIVTSFVPEIVLEIKNNAPAGVQNPVAMAIVVVFAWVVAWIAPFLGLPNNLFGLLIIGFGVFEAWKINKRTQLLITGPFGISTINASPMPPQDVLDSPPLAN